MNFDRPALLQIITYLIDSSYLISYPYNSIMTVRVGRWSPSTTSNKLPLIRPIDIATFLLVSLKLDPAIVHAGVGLSSTTKNPNVPQHFTSICVLPAICSLLSPEIGLRSSGRRAILRNSDDCQCALLN